MTDRYERIRAALAMGPTPGPWYGIQHEGSRWINIYQGDYRQCAAPIAYVAPCNILDEDGISWKENKGETIANAGHVAACDPDTIRALLAERDALARDAARYRWLSAMATQQADHLGPIFRIDVRRSEPYLFNFDAAIDAAMQRTNAREGEQ